MQLIKNKYDCAVFETLHDLFNFSMSLPEESILRFDESIQDSSLVVLYFLFENAGDSLMIMRNHQKDEL